MNKQLKPVNNNVNEESTDLIQDRISHHHHNHHHSNIVSPPSPALLNGTSRNMNYDHRKYTNLGSVVPRNNHESTAASASTIVEKKQTTTSPKHHHHHHHHHQAALATTDEDLMDSFEARMLQEMKAEMEAEKQLTNQRGSDARKNGSTTTTTSGVGSHSSHTTTASSKSKKKTTKENSINPEEQNMTENDHRLLVDANGGDVVDAEGNSPDMARRGSSGMQSPWSDDQQTTSEKYNFDAMTSSIEDTTTSISKKAVLNHLINYIIYIQNL